MARPLKDGIDYFPIDIDIFDDEKVIPISSQYGAAGECILIRLLCAIFRNGYYIEYTEAFKFKIAKQSNLPNDLVSNVINELIKWGFFNEKLYKSDRILTSAGIQKRWLIAIRKRVKKDKYPFWLLESITSEKIAEKEFLPEETPPNRTETTQKKLDQIKRDNIREEEKKKKKEYTSTTSKNDSLNFKNEEQAGVENENTEDRNPGKEKIKIGDLNTSKINDEFLPIMKEFYDYRKKLKKPILTDRTLNMAYNKLFQLSNGDILQAENIINITCDNNWTTFWAIKPQNMDAKNKQTISEESALDFINKLGVED